MICKISPWLKLEILEVLVNTLTADDKYPVWDCENLQFPIQMQLSQKRKIFLDFLFHLWNLHQILNIFKKKMIVIANVFPKLKTVETWLDHSLKSAVSQHPLAINMLNGRKPLWNLHQSTFFRIFWSLILKMTWKISPFLNFEMLGVFVNTLTDDENYPFRDYWDLQFRIQMGWSSKPKIFSQFFVAFMESSRNFNNFRKKDDRNSLCISKITHCQRLG